MKVGLIIADLNIRGGTHKQLVRLAEFLHGKGCSVSIHTFIFEPAKCYPEIRQFAVAETKRRGRRQSFAAAWRLVNGLPSDVNIINVHDLSCYSAMFFAKLLRPKAKLVWQINDLPAQYHVGPGKAVSPHWSDVLVRSSVWVIARLCDAITVNVRKNQVRVSGLMGVEPLLFYPGVDQTRKTFLPRQLSAPLRLLSIGVFFPYRNYEVIINAMDLLRARGVETQLVLVGATHLAPDYCAKIAALAAEKKLNVEITGEIDERQITASLESSHLFLFANLEQSWGLAVFEAMNMSLPVVLSDSVGAVELLRDCPGVRIVDATSAEEAASAIAEVCSDAKSYAAMASTAFEFSQSLGWDKLYCPGILDLFERLTSARRPEPMSQVK